MIRISALAPAMILFIALDARQGDASEYAPRNGYWRSEIVVKSEDGSTEAKTFSRSSFPATCSSGLDNLAEKVEQSNGYVWIGLDGGLVLFAPSDLATTKYEVTGIGCKFYPWK